MDWMDQILIKKQHIGNKLIYYIYASKLKTKMCSNELQHRLVEALTK